MFFKCSKNEELFTSMIRDLKRKNQITKTIQLVIGILIMAFAYNLFILPSSIVYGVSGLGVMFKQMYNIDPSFIILSASIVLLALSYIFLGSNATKNTIIGSILYPILVKLTEEVPEYIDLGSTEPIIIALFGAILTGIGLGFVFKAGYTTGGTDILNHIFSKYFKMSVGSAMYLTDGIIIVISLFCLGFNCFAYSVISLYIISMMTDKLMIGISASKTFYIITDNETDLKKFLLMNLCHGVTILSGRGGYTGDNKKIIMCIVPTKEYVIVKEGIKKIDPEAFFLVTDAYEVAGAE